MDEIVSYKERWLIAFVLLAFTIIYLSVFPFFFMFFWLSLALHVQTFPIEGPLLIVISLLPPLSILASVVFLWLRFFQKKYKNVLFYCGFPVATTLASVSFIFLVEDLIKCFK